MERYLWFEDRLDTFGDWPKSKPTSISLAEAGFYYLQYEDTVECFVCGQKLKEWQPDDCPWNEHRRHSPHCLYLKMVKPKTYQKGYVYEWKGKLRDKTSTMATSHQVYPDFKSCLSAAKKHDFDYPDSMGIYLWIVKVDENGKEIEEIEVNKLSKMDLLLKCLK